MLLLLEISKPFQWRPWRYRSRTGWRVGWGFLALAQYSVRLEELLSGDYVFDHKEGWN